MLRDAWAADASTWLTQHQQLKRAYDKEVEETRAAEARANALAAHAARRAVLQMSRQPSA